MGWEDGVMAGGGQGALLFLQGALDAHLAPPCHASILVF